MKKFSGLLIIAVSLVLVMALGSLFLLVKIGIEEQNDYKLINHSQQIAEELYQYRKIQGKFPSTLKEAGIDEKVCVTLECTTFRYKVSEDRQDFKLAAPRGLTFVVVYYPDWDIIAKGGECCSALVVQENSGREDFPKYRTDKRFFKVPSDWPEL